MPKVPAQIIAEIRDRTDLVDLVGGYVTLKRSGRNFQGLCPFHQEKTPSFNVNPDRAIYHCFGCGVTGDAYKFLMEHDHLSFPEALRMLAERVGVDLTPYEKGRGDAGEFDQLYRAHAIASRLYQKLLRGPEGAAARAELERRGLSDELVERYHLGASADAWDRLIVAARQEGIDPSVLERGGLALARESKTGHYDRFRNRLMFPIEAAGEKVVGFGGRILGEGDPKYLNSPESMLFHKRKTLYGFPQVRHEIREDRRAILVEGYTDVLSLVQQGFRGVVASLGTAFTADHADFLAKSCDQVVALFDGDDAGRKATQASCGPLLAAGLEVRVVRLPRGEDPDSFLRKEGPDALHAEIDRARGVIETILSEDRYFDGGAAQDRAVKRVLQVLAPIQDPVRRKAYLEELAITAGVRERLPEELLVQELSKTRKEQQAKRAPSDTTDRPVPSAAVVTNGKAPVVERTFVGVLLHDPTRAEDLLERFGPDSFEYPLARRAIEAASRMLGEGRDLSAPSLMAEFENDEPTRAFLGELCVSEQYAVSTEQQIEDCRAYLERRDVEREMKEVSQEIRRAQAEGETARVLDFARRKSELARQLAALGAPKSAF